jgi:hypothetical protein
MKQRYLLDITCGCDKFEVLDDEFYFQVLQHNKFSWNSIRPESNAFFQDLVVDYINTSIISDSRIDFHLPLKHRDFAMVFYLPKVRFILPKLSLFRYYTFVSAVLRKYCNANRLSEVKGFTEEASWFIRSLYTTTKLSLGSEDSLPASRSIKETLKQMSIDNLNSQAISDLQSSIVEFLVLTIEEFTFEGY